VPFCGYLLPETELPQEGAKGAKGAKGYAHQRRREKILPGRQKT
jgi:hypothetical protein